MLLLNRSTSCCVTDEAAFSKLHELVDGQQSGDDTNNKFNYLFATASFSVASLAIAYHLWNVYRKISFDEWIVKYKPRTLIFSSNCQTQRPPEVVGHFLWGNTVEFSKNTAVFLRRVAREYGDLALIRLVSRKLVVLNDIHSFPLFCHESKFDFRPIIDQVNRNVFGFSVPNVDEHRKRLVYFYRSVKVYDTVILFDAHLNQSLDDIDQRAENVNIHDFAIRTGFLAVFQTLLGTDRNNKANTIGSQQSDDYNQWQQKTRAAQFYANYSIFVKYFNHLWLGLPLMIFPRAYRAFSKMMSLHPSLAQVVARGNACPYLYMACKLMRENGGSEVDILRHSIELIHVHANIVRLAYWMIVHTLSSEEACKALTEEIDKLVKQKKAVYPDDSTSTLYFEIEDVESLHSLASIFKETLRLVSGVIVIRGVTQDTQFKTESGKTYQLKRGETVFFYPAAHHRDPEIFTNPERFVWDRFIGAVTFYKNGKPVEKPVLGFGSMCIGQRFATLLAKWYVVQMFQRWDMRLTGPVPDVDEAYQGHEVLPPKSDTTFSYEPREGALMHLRIASSSSSSDIAF